MSHPLTSATAVGIPHMSAFERIADVDRDNDSVLPVAGRPKPRIKRSALEGRAYAAYLPRDPWRR